MLKPAYNYLLLKRLDKETGVVTEVDIENTHQRYQIIAINDDWCGWYENGVPITVNYQIGEVVYVQKHAEADTPKELAQRGEALVLASRVMAVEGK